MRTCSVRDREYNIPLRIGLIFVILATSFIGKQNDYYWDVVY